MPAIKQYTSTTAAEYTDTRVFWNHSQIWIFRYIPCDQGLLLHNSHSFYWNHDTRAYSSYYFRRRNSGMNRNLDT